MGSRPKNNVVKEAFKACQDSFAVHPKLVKRLRKYYEETDVDRFFEAFMYYLKYPISGYVERSMYVDRTLEFVAKFACSFREKEQEEEGKEGEGEKEEEELPLFLYRLFAWLLDHHEVEGADARLRVCQLLNKLLKYMGEEACIDDDLYNKIYDGMLNRLKDRVAEIRSQAVTALQRLQDPRDEDCPIIKAYLFHLAHDPNNVVRRTIVRCIGATRLTLPHVLERTRDADDHVRRAAYKFLAEKVHIKSLTIGQREGLLQRGLGERSEAVRRVVEKELLPAWLRLSGDNIVQLLHHLDVGNSDQEAAPRAGARPSAPVGALTVLFHESPPRELVEQFQYLDQAKLVPYEKLTAETAMYWRVLAQYLRDEGAEECLEAILPELTPYCQYVRRFILETERGAEELDWEFVARELVALTAVFDLGDEVGRRHLTALVKALLTSPNTPTSFVPALAEVFARVERDPMSRVNQVAEVISELRDPMTAQASGTRNSSNESSDIFFDAADRTPSPGKAASAQNEREILAKQTEVAGLRVKMNELKEELSSAVAGQDFILAQEVKRRLDGVEEEVARREEEVRLLKGTSVAAEVDPTSIPESDEEEEAGTGEDTSPAVLLKCLKLLTATMQDPKITSLNATLHTLMETFVTGSVQSEVAGVRREAIVALCCLCLRSPDSARQHMLLMLQAAHIDTHEVRMAAISAVVDLLMRHGLASFITSPQAEELDNSGTGSCAASRCADTADSGSNVDYLDSDIHTRGATLTQSELNTQGGNSVVAILTKILDEPDLELRTETAEGLCKLLMIGAISSSKLLSRLLLIWYNPMTEATCKLRHILGTFFPLYASMSRANQVGLEGAFIPTMRVLFDAPITSPLNEIDNEDVGMFFVHLTREDMLQQHDPKRAGEVVASSTTSVHDNLAKLVGNEILSAPDAYQAKVLIKVLTNLQLTANNFVHLRELSVLSEQLLATVRERTAVRSLEKFHRQLQAWLAKEPGAEPRQERRRSAAQVEEEAEVSANLSQGSPGRKRRVLFSQSQGTLLDPEEQGPGVEEQEEVAERTTIPSPVAPEGADRSRVVDATFTGVLSSTRLSGGSTGEEEVTVVPDTEEEEEQGVEEQEEQEEEQGVEEVEVTVSKGKRAVKAKVVPKVAEVVPPSDTEEEEEVQALQVLTDEGSDDDIFSDASSASISQLPTGNLLAADSTEEEEEEEEATPRASSRKVVRAGKAFLEESSEEEATPVARNQPRARAKQATKAPTEEEEATPKPTKARGRAGRAAKASAGEEITAGAKGRAKRSARASTEEEEEEATPVAKTKARKETSTKGRGKPKKASVVEEEEERGRRGVGTVASTTSLAPPARGRARASASSPSVGVGTSRSGRSNSPRIDYRTGRPVEGEAPKTPEGGRKRSSARGGPPSTTSSPTAKKSSRSSRK